MSESIDYDSATHHVEKRASLSEELKLAVTELQKQSGTRNQWPHHQRFAGEAEFWLQVHKALLGATAELPRQCAALMLVLDDPESRKKQLTRLAQLGGQLIHHAHTQQHVEDHHFFPLFKRVYPNLKQHIELLDGDHRVLTESLDQLETAFKTIPVIAKEEDRQEQSRLSVKTEQLYKSAKRANTLFLQHIADEEEICIPALLQM